MIVRIGAVSFHGFFEVFERVGTVAAGLGGSQIIEDLIERNFFGDEAEGATFVEPGLEDENNDWGARGALLEKYRRLVSLMQSRGIEPVFPFPLNRLPNFEKRVW